MAPRYSIMFQYPACLYLSVVPVYGWKTCFVIWITVRTTPHNDNDLDLKIAIAIKKIKQFYVFTQMQYMVSMNISSYKPKAGSGRQHTTLQHWTVCRTCTNCTSSHHLFHDIYIFIFSITEPVGVWLNNTHYYFNLKKMENMFGILEP